MKRFFICGLIFILTFTLSFTTLVFADDDTQVPFLLYHSVLTDYTPGSDALLHISQEMFSEHMQALKDVGYNTVTLDEYYSFVKDNKPLPAKPIVICFDDGYENNYYNAYPILKEKGMQATIFVIASRVGDQTVEFPHFNWQQAMEMEQSGVIDIESHSLTHPSFSEITYDETVKEMRLSKYLIETNMNKECKYMAYPFGFTNEFSSDVAVKAGYKMLCIVGNDGVNSKYSDLSYIKRLNVSGDMNSLVLLKYIESNYNN